ncbi:hypothetical protein EDL99_07650 [Ornithobacterium rhinotracheale]|uniref:hypothetical protein n=1 Tax=Ornithobacterium rhinotracheale TaxID=28251 RepID=UPI00129CDBDD|nr:hypothetical protein [Ornithobacterium rhinotracheale]MRJ08738.1 hypothetical protein [Ornithobacterium rhinotracheale]UOH77117.1 hypothetical protein MT996_07795 [Ornithobacterium rhinotracheale]
MKIQFSEKYMYINLILGILWIVLGLYFVFISEDDWWGYYLYLVVGILYFLVFLTQIWRNYAEIKEDRLVVYGIPNKEIKFKDLREVKYFAGDYIFVSDQKKIKIPKVLIQKDQQLEFEAFFQGLQKEI